MSYTMPAAGSHFISREDAVEMTALYRKERTSVLAPSYKAVTSDILCNSETFNIEDVKVLMNQPDCLGLRIYYGMKEDLSIHAILVGVDSTGGDIIPSVGNPGDPDPGVFLEDAARCPDSCGPGSILTHSNA